MKNVQRIETPLSPDTVSRLRCGDRVLLSGFVYTARDQAHRRMFDALGRGEALPFPLEGRVIFYAGPTPAPPGAVIGAVGPTTASRMDRYTPALLERGLGGMIGKGKRSTEVVEAIRKHGAVYFGAMGGVAALLSRCVREASVVAYGDLGPEAVRKLLVEEFPLIVVNDREGRDLYEEAVRTFGRERRSPAGT
ncbi:MAG TPA: Fe-S-containing hydro-lyase [Syntrophales bacterium]|nr:Fe-S-containing hydro-lyase [Syntrophales bacterium]